MRRHEGGAGPAPPGGPRSNPVGYYGPPGSGPRGTRKREKPVARWTGAFSSSASALARHTPSFGGMEKETGQPQARPNPGPLKLGSLTFEYVEFVRCVVSVRPRASGGPVSASASLSPGSPLARGRTLERTDNRISSEYVSLADFLLRSFEPELANERAPLLLLRLDVGANALDRGRIERDQAQIGHALDHVGTGHDPLHLGMQPLDHRLRRRRRRHEHVPRHRLVVVGARSFRERRH